MKTATETTFCADATKLIAADSWLEGELCDPEAREAFAHLTTVMTNRTNTYFFKRQKLHTADLGIVGRQWMESSNVNRLKDQSRSASVPQIHMDNEKANWFARSFRGGAAEDAVRWVQFQAETDKLMQIFWGTNEEEELAHSYKVLVASGVDLTGITKVATKVRTSIVENSQSALANEGKFLTQPWTDTKLAIAFLAWAYIKAFRYFEQIKSSNSSSAYLVHFVRTHIFDVHTGLKGPVVETGLDSFFPWGELLSSPEIAIQRADFAQRYSTSISHLRIYTTRESDKFWSDIAGLKEYVTSRRPPDVKAAIETAKKKTVEFAIAGLTSAELYDPERDTDDVVFEVVTKVLGYVLGIPELALMAFLYGARMKEKSDEYVTLVRSRFRAKRVVQASMGSLESFLKRQGLDSDILST